MQQKFKVKSNTEYKIEEICKSTVYTIKSKAKYLLSLLKNTFLLLLCSSSH